MKNNHIQEVIVGSVLVLLAVLLLNPFHFWMPDMMHVVVCVLILAVFALFAIFMLRENAGDDRDDGAGAGFGIERRVERTVGIESRHTVAD